LIAAAIRGGIPGSAAVTGEDAQAFARMAVAVSRALPRRKKRRPCGFPSSCPILLLFNNKEGR
jgi:hypothetical protein